MNRRRLCWLCASLLLIVGIVAVVLALEIDITRNSMNRMRIYASLNVAEVWRWHRNDTLEFLALNVAEKYDPVATSPTFSMPITPNDLLPFIAMRGTMDENAVIREFRAWIRTKLAATQP